MAGVGRYKPLLPANTIFGNGWIIVRSATCLRGDDKSDFAHEFIASVRREGEAIAAATPTGVDG
ncbi:hypothetical protein [Acuticoccus sp.]|uniref:hypothetical protein n=1 Tax=Acuticoccus sp. TaxID=1904378 RepID=UPI003B52C575